MKKLKSLSTTWRSSAGIPSKLNANRRTSESTTSGADTVAEQGGDDSNSSGDNKSGDATTPQPPFPIQANTQRLSGHRERSRESFL